MCCKSEKEKVNGLDRIKKVNERGESFKILIGEKQDNTNIQNKFSTSLEFFLKQNHLN